MSQDSSSITNPEKESLTRVDPEVKVKPERRRFTAEYKRRILKEVAACKDPGQIGALLRSEGLYSSNLTNWRKQMASGDPNALEPRKRGPKTDPLAIENAALKKRNQKLEEELKRAKIVIDVQKKLCDLLGLPTAPELEEQ